MSKLKMSPEELEAESLKLHNLRQEMSKARLQAVEEMSKHPLSLEQMREQSERLRRDANRLDRKESKAKSK